jgi:hypothetical protein
LQKHPSLRGAERRQFGRRNTICHAMACARGRPSSPCVVRDVSLGGAKVELELSASLPNRFRLIVSAWQFEADCEVVHRTDESVGVRFLNFTGEAPWLVQGENASAGDPGVRRIQSP